jgi:hypothetical protein
MRGEPNAVGIVTKAEPSNEPQAFLQDDRDRAATLARWDQDFARIEAHLAAGGTVIWPADGIGTGRANMKNCAPKLWGELCQRLRPLFVLDAERPQLIIIAAGGRTFSDWFQAKAAITHISGKFDLVEVIEGGAAGADTVGGMLADRFGLLRRTEHAKWDEFARQGQRHLAGPTRNSVMANMLSDRREQTGVKVGLLAFAGGAGTANMIRTAESMNIRPMKIEPDPQHKAAVEAAEKACALALQEQPGAAAFARDVVNAFVERRALSRLTGVDDTALEAATRVADGIKRRTASKVRPDYATRDLLIAYQAACDWPAPVTAPNESPTP